MKIRKLLLLALLAVISSHATGCSKECSNTVLTTLDSPDKKLRATVFKRSGGATVADSIHIYVGSLTDTDYDVGNVFRGNNYTVCEVYWESASELKITTDADVFLLMKEYAGIHFVMDQKKAENK